MNCRYTLLKEKSRIKEQLYLRIKAQGVFLKISKNIINHKQTVINKYIKDNIVLILFKNQVQGFQIKKLNLL